MTAARSLRVILDEARDGAMNMGIDQVLLESANAGETQSTLRFYHWNVPTVSLGYFQKALEIDNQTETIRALSFVRRPTGGGAILHDDEITYSLTLPLAAFAEPPGIEEMYRVVHDSFLEVLSGMRVPAVYRGGQDPEHSVGGPFFCFARAYRLDLTLAGDKLLGSAQRRLRHAAMQHGSFILGRTHTEQPSAELKVYLAGEFDEAIFCREVADAAARRLGFEPAEGDFSAEELERAEESRRVYASDAWNRRR
ncbi:MAG: lipoate--protein ligase family protein [Spirochaetales bacterium]|nr:lipoate--protein ligase family protein [Spirochaetales bacterium]